MPTFTVMSGEEVQVDENNYIETRIVVSLEEAVDHELDGFLNLVSERVTGTDLLTDVSYGVAGVTPDGELILKVEGDISMLLDSE
jgi:hypothetical protein